MNKYLVTFTDTVVVHADTETEAVGKAEALRAFAGPDTEDVYVEELDGPEQPPNLRGKLGGGPHPA